MFSPMIDISQDFWDKLDSPTTTTLNLCSVEGQSKEIREEKSLLEFWSNSNFPGLNMSPFFSHLRMRHD